MLLTSVILLLSAFPGTLGSHPSNIVSKILPAARRFFKGSTEFNSTQSLNRETSPFETTTTAILKNTNNSTMGQAMRMLSYDDAGNRLHAISVLKLGGGDCDGPQMNWYRLDDGVMGGRSSTHHNIDGPSLNLLHFQGTINTGGGGFCSIRSNFPPNEILEGTTSEDYSLKLRYRGDGKTYKLLLSDGSRGGPMSSSPSWQVDLPTLATTKDDEWEERIIPLSKLLPSFAGSRTSTDDYMKYSIYPKEMKEIGLMLSLRLSNGQPNPVETFGKGIFPFSLHVESIEILKTQQASQENVGSTASEL